MSFYDIHKGFVQAKLQDLYPDLLNQVPYFFNNYSSETEGRNFYKGILKKVTIDSKVYTKKDFEKTFSKAIDNELKFILDSIYRNIAAKNRKREDELIHIAEMNSINRKLKRVPSLFEQKYMDKYYIYNSAVYQVVKIQKGIGSVSMLVEKPSGKLTEIVLSVEDFTKRLFFKRKNEAIEYLLNVWLKENNITKRKEEYISYLKEKYSFLIKEEDV